MSDIGNGGFSCCPSIVIPQANVVIASNVLSTTGNVLCANIISGDGTFTGNLYVQGQILGTIIYNSLNVFALANIGVVQAGSIFGNGFGISNLNSSNLSGIIPPSLIYGNTISNIQAANISGLVAVTGNTLSNLNASNIAFGIVGPSLIYGNTLSNIQAANISGLVAVTGNTLSNLNASNIAFGIVSSAFIYGNTISNLNSANITQPFANLVVSNTVTTNNTNVQSTLQVTGAMTSNIANTTFYYDTFTIPYINTQVLNVGAITSLTTANVTTLNVQSLFANSMIVYGANTLNVVGISNLNSITANYISGNGAGISNLNSSNLLGIISSTLIFGNTLSNVQMANVVGLTGNTLSNLNASNLAFGVVNSSLIYGNTISNVNSANIIQPFTNLAVTNTVTTTNIVAAGFTSNITNTVFNFDTLTIPFVNSSTLNVSSTTNLTTLNVTSISNLISLAATTANISTLNVATISNVNSFQVTNNVFASNALQTTNLFVTGNVATVASTVFQSFNFSVAATAGSFTNVCSVVDSPNGSGIYAIYADMMTRGAGGSAQTKTYIITCNYNSTAGVWTRALPISNPTAGGQIGLDVMTLNGTTYLRATNRNAAEIVSVGMVIRTSSSTFSTVAITDLTAQTGTGATSTGFYPTTALTQVAGRVGITIESPLANLHVVGNQTIAGLASNISLSVTGNAAISNALTTANLFASTVSTTNPIPFRNRIINGGMTVWQRNVASISTTASLYTTADRWCGALGTSGLLLSQWPGPTENTQFPYSLQVTTSTTTTGVPLVEQRIENLNIPDFINGTPVTVSFYAGQPYGTLMPLTVGLYYATAVNNFGTQTLAVAATQNTPTLTTANVQYSLTFTLTTSLGATNGLSLRFTTGGASAIGSTILLTAVQVEKGLLATPFEVRPYGTELRLAQRYYYQLTSPTAAVQGSAAVYAIFGTATGITTTAFWLPLQFPVPMRTPNYTFSNSVVTNFQLLPTGTTTITNVGVQSDSYTPVGATLNFVGTNIVPTASYIFRTNNLSGSTVAFFGFSCEL